MKHLLSTLLAIFFVMGVSAQTIWLVDNTTTAPGGANVVANLQTAIDNASPGDIIHVKPSSTSYGNITITNTSDSISIFGIGFNPDKEIKQTASIGNLYVSGRNIKLSGLISTGTSYIGYTSVTGGTGNLSFENMEFAGGNVLIGYSYSVNNVLFRNCIFRTNFQTYSGRVNAVVANNCIFSWNSTSTTQGQLHLYDGTLISHCLVIGDGAASRYAFNDLYNSTVSNTIFYGRSPQVDIGNYSNSTFNNCFVSQTFEDSIPAGNGNSVNATIASISGGVFSDPNVILTLNWNKNWLPDLDPASTELFNTGDDGSDIGLTGGTIPYNPNGTPLPYIQRMVIPSVIRQGDNLDVTIDATGGN